MVGLRLFRGFLGVLLKHYLKDVTRYYRLSRCAIGEAFEKLKPLNCLSVNSMLL